MLQYLQWVRLLSFTWFLLLEKHQESILGGQKEIPGIIYKIKGCKFLQPLSQKNRNAYLIVLRRIAPFFPFEPYFFQLHLSI
jgi:hypothetical protein